MLVVKNPPANAGIIRDAGSIPGSRWSPGEGNGNPLQYSCLENPMDRGAWWATVYGVTRVRHDWSDLVHEFPLGVDNQKLAPGLSWTLPFAPFSMLYLNFYLLLQETITVSIEAYLNSVSPSSKLSNLRVVLGPYNIRLQTFLKITWSDRWIKSAIHKLTKLVLEFHNQIILSPILTYHFLIMTYIFTHTNKHLCTTACVNIYIHTTL